jgi:hypothetical protein
MSKPEPITTIIRTEQDAARAWVVICNAKASPDNPIEVTVKPYELTRSLAQNRLYRKWLHIIADSTGDDADNLHEVFKVKYLVPILCKYDDSYAERIQAVRDLRRAGNADYADYARALILECLTSTTKLKKKGFTEYLEHVEKAAAELGIVLPQPDEQRTK